ncbi:extracellular glycoprotein lacritin isoform X2 [Diceros bicornis minor]|uniref:extracellular glycoprotein lacritin isoform X2 n=1 Tax=Diceros bicornis minor TaxID=77932 RepID=UPI0026ED87D2|nr:extracellular glycoprotein lacritin isoform X2 [Diceros bicornis minor]
MNNHHHLTRRSSWKEDASSDAPEALPTKAPVTLAELDEEVTGPVEPASPQETAATQDIPGVTPGEPGLSSVKSTTERRISIARRAIEGAGEGLQERIEDGKNLIQRGDEIAAKVKKISSSLAI